MAFYGGAGGGSDGDHYSHDGFGGGGSSSSEDPLHRKKRYHRHTAYQIQRLEATFKECPHPDEKQRQLLSRELGLAPRQIKFWFQNRRTQMKAQHERADNCALRAENDRIRCENIAIREALKTVICPSCGSQPTDKDPYFDEQKLRVENAQLREELDRVSSIAAKYIGRPISQLPPVSPMHISSPLDLSMATSSYGAVPPSCLIQPHLLSDIDRPFMAETAASAMAELLRLVHTNEPLWVKSPKNNGRDVLDLATYRRMFTPAGSSSERPSLRVEASRDSRVVIMDALSLVDMIMDADKWIELFPTIVSTAKTIQVVSSSPMLSRHNGSLQLMYEELQILSPVLPTREFVFLRCCQQIEDGSWAVADVSYEVASTSRGLSRWLPSGFLIQNLPDGYSKVTRVDHVEVEDKSPVHRFYRDLVHSSYAFGAERWLATLERMCERIATTSATRDLPGVVPTPEGKRSMMKLSQRMVNNFTASIRASSQWQQRWIPLSRVDDTGIRIALHISTEPGQPSGVIVSAATTVWLPISPQIVFSFFRDERTRQQWDVLSNGNAVQEVANIANGSHPGNCISVLRAFNYASSENSNMLILQESCIDSTGSSMVVYCPVDLPAINLAMNGDDTSYIPLLPSGFTVTPDGRQDGEGPSSSTGGAATAAGGGSLVTVAFQILVSSVPTSRLSLESVDTVNHLISATVQQIKAALNCPPPGPVAAAS
ncbi:hypothetical protein SAY87_004452 [Trapa incisa]|uniref:Uncharacterized protein n=1 Tax=Trapa incisa TaxID=236973 RepID=A0AAN7JPF8_9MYRT|nr:hypothetical protein SAY87_004452 [Trapa incisa]